MINYDGLNPGIRKLAKLLNDHGFKTTDSGDGTNHANGMEGAMEFCHVVCFVKPEEMVEEANRLMLLLRQSVKDGAEEYGPEGYTIEATYTPFAPDLVSLCVFHLCDKDLL